MENEPLFLQFDAYGVTRSLLKNWKLIKQLPEAMSYSVNLHGKLQPFNFFK
ncbi:hypothetical protein GAPWKB11_1428 [Gilliamella apicola]|nr:hypothetical protein GAPWKB11_1428 [Gilliamella apicola]